MQLPRYHPNWQDAHSLRYDHTSVRVTAHEPGRAYSGADPFSRRLRKDIRRPPRAWLAPIAGSLSDSFRLLVSINVFGM